MPDTILKIPEHHKTQISIDDVIFSPTSLSYNGNIFTFTYNDKNGNPKEFIFTSLNDPKAIKENKVLEAIKAVLTCKDIAPNASGFCRCFSSFVSDAPNSDIELPPYDPNFKGLKYNNTGKPAAFFAEQLLGNRATTDKEPANLTLENLQQKSGKLTTSNNGATINASTLIDDLNNSGVSFSDNSHLTEESYKRIANNPAVHELSYEAARTHPAPGLHKTKNNQLGLLATQVVTSCPVRFTHDLIGSTNSSNYVPLTGNLDNNPTVTMLNASGIDRTCPPGSGLTNSEIKAHIEGMFQALGDRIKKEGLTHVSLVQIGMGVFAGEGDGAETAKNAYADGIAKLASENSSVEFHLPNGLFNSTQKQKITEAGVNIHSKCAAALAQKLSIDDPNNKVGFLNPSDPTVTFGSYPFGCFGIYGTGDGFVGEEFLANVTTGMCFNAKILANVLDNKATLGPSDPAFSSPTPVPFSASSSGAGAGADHHASSSAGAGAGASTGASSGSGAGADQDSNITVSISDTNKLELQFSSYDSFFLFMLDHNKYILSNTKNIVINNQNKTITINEGFNGYENRLQIGSTYVYKSQTNQLAIVTNDSESLFTNNGTVLTSNKYPGSTTTTHYAPSNVQFDPNGDIAEIEAPADLTAAVAADAGADHHASSSAGAGAGATSASSAGGTHTTLFAQPAIHLNSTHYETIRNYFKSIHGSLPTQTFNQLTDLKNILDLMPSINGDSLSIKPLVQDGYIISGLKPNQIQELNDVLVNTASATLGNS